MVHILDTPYTKTGDLYSYHEKRDIHSPSNTLPLLLTSRQASVKTQWTLNRIQKTAYVLDVSVLNEGDMFSTWVSVPQLTTHLSTLHMDMRLFGRMATSNELRPQGSHPDLNHFNCNFYAILDRFLPYGPVNEKKGGSGTPYEDRVITVENFVIDFRSAERNLPFPPRDMGYRDWLTHIANTWHGDQRVDKAPKYETRPKWPLYLLRSWLKSTIGMGYGTAEFGGIIYERIGTIFMMVNGRLETTLDLADGLAKLLVQSPPRHSGLCVSGCWCG